MRVHLRRAAYTLWYGPLFTNYEHLSTFGFAGVDELTKVPELETLLCMW